MLSDKGAAGLAADLLAALDSENEPGQGRMGRVTRYLDGDHDLPYMPRGAKAEYRHIAERSVTNWLPLIADTFAKALFVDGYRPARETENARPWEFWQANRLDARQSIAHRGAVAYGVSYVAVLPGDPVPVIRPVPAVRSFAVYEEDDDEWPVHGLTVVGQTAAKERLLNLYDDEAVYTVVVGEGKDFSVRSFETHALGVCPLVRFRDRLDAPARGLVDPLIPLQDRVNETVFSLMVALQYASFRQRWATGLAIPVDESETLDNGQPNPNFGQPVEPFKAAVDRLWVTDSPEAKFGDFAQTDVSGHLNAYESAVRSLSAVAQTSPALLLGDVQNISAEALASFEFATQRKVGELETLFGESWEQVLRLAAAAAGDTESAQDVSAQVRWRDSEARSMKATVEALGIMVQTLGVPAEGAWERIPGVTDQDVERWRGLASTGDGLQALADALTRQAAPAIAEGGTTTGG